MNEKHILEAANVGLILLDESPLVKTDGSLDFNYKRYKFISCGHEQYFQPTHVRRNHIKCLDCFEKDVNDKLLDAGLKVLSRGSTTQQVVVQNLNCGHVYEIYKASRNTRNTDSSCKQCYEERLTIEAFEKNLQLLGSSNRGGTYRRYKFNLCEHEQDIVAQCVPVERFRCQQCKEEKYKTDAAMVGLEYIGLANNTKYECQRRLYRLPCGCQKELRMDHAASGSYLCENCEDSYYVKPSNVYLFKMQAGDFSWLKLGFAKDLQNRINGYGYDGEVEILAVKAFEDGYSAMTFEKSIHRKYKKIKHKKDLMKLYLKTSGFTECYPVEAETLLIGELK